MNRILAIDGACRYNGTPECCSAGACFVLQYDTHEVIADQHIFTDISSKCLTAVEESESSSQRGELFGMLQALQVWSEDEQGIIVTDSEYIFNSVSRKWYERWQYNGWKTADGTDVKNQELWRTIMLYDIQEVPIYHVKGHLAHITPKRKQLIMDANALLVPLFLEAVNSFRPKDDKLQAALDLADKNNGIGIITADNIPILSAANLCADALATSAIHGGVI